MLSSVAREETSRISWHGVQPMRWSLNNAKIERPRSPPKRPISRPSTLSLVQATWITDFGSMSMVDLATMLGGVGLSEHKSWLPGPDAAAVAKLKQRIGPSNVFARFPRWRKQKVYAKPLNGINLARSQKHGGRRAGSSSSEEQRPDLVNSGARVSPFPKHPAVYPTAVGELVPRPAPSHGLPRKSDSSILDDFVQKNDTTLARQSWPGMSVKRMESALPSDAKATPELRHSFLTAQSSSESEWTRAGQSADESGQESSYRPGKRHTSAAAAVGKKRESVVSALDDPSPRSVDFSPSMRSHFDSDSDDEYDDPRDALTLSGFMRRYTRSSRAHRRASRERPFSGERNSRVEAVLRGAKRMRSEPILGLSKPFTSSQDSGPNPVARDEVRVSASSSGKRRRSARQSANDHVPPVPPLPFKVMKITGLDSDTWEHAYRKGKVVGEPSRAVASSIGNLDASSRPSPTRRFFERVAKIFR